MAHAGILLDKKRFTGLMILPKPGIVALVIVSGITGLYLGGHGVLHTRIAFWTLLGLALSTAGSAVLNNFIDRDIDSVMDRTKGRSLPSGAVSASAAYFIGTGLVLASLIIMKIAVGAQAALLTGMAVFIYVVLYSLFLKRHTPFATHIGGIAGAMPPLIGYAAAHGGIDVHAVVLFLIIVVWQQPHFWSLALKYREDYARAGVPNHAVAMGVEPTKRRIMAYVAVHLPMMILPYQVGMAGKWYLATAMTMTLVYIALTARFVFSGRDKDLAIFHFSNIYLVVVFGAMIADAVNL